jgi:hypothetical protein
MTTPPNGTTSLFRNTTGFSNTALGSQALPQIQTALGTQQLALNRFIQMPLA